MTSDAEQISAIYLPIVKESTISFEMDAPDAEEISRKIVAALTAHEQVMNGSWQLTIVVLQAMPTLRNTACAMLIATALRLQPMLMSDAGDKEWVKNCMTRYSRR